MNDEIKVSVLDQVTKIVIDSFGEELGRHFIENSMILPLRDKACLIKEHKFEFFNYRYLKDMPEGLGVKMSPKLYVFDIDQHNLVVGNPNVLTTKGGHYWFTGGNFTKTLGGGTNTHDLKVTGYVEFHGPGKSLQHSTILDYFDLPNELHNLIEDHSHVSCLSLTANTIQIHENEDSFKEQIHENKVSYRKQVLEDGWQDIDLDWVINKECSSMRKVQEGHRSNTFWRKRIEFYRLELDPAPLEQAALETGLLPQQIAAQSKSAQEQWTNPKSVSQSQKSFTWLEYVDKATDKHPSKEKIIAAAWWVANMGVVQNNSAPYCCMSTIGAEAGIHRTYVPVLLKLLVPLGLCKYVPNPRRYVENGVSKKMSPNVHMLIDGRPT